MGLALRKHDRLPLSVVATLGRGDKIEAIRLPHEDQQIGLKEARGEIEGDLQASPALFQQMQAGGSGPHVAALGSCPARIRHPGLFRSCRTMTQRVNPALPQYARVLVRMTWSISLGSVHRPMRPYPVLFINVSAPMDRSAAGTTRGTVMNNAG